jgi:hypothetical protein
LRGKGRRPVMIENALTTMFHRIADGMDFA